MDPCCKLLKLLFIMLLGSCIAEVPDEFPPATDDPSALKDGRPGGNPHTVLVEVPYERPADYGSPIVGTGIRIGPCTVLTAAHTLVSDSFAYNRAEPTKPGWLLKWLDAKAFSLLADGGVDRVRPGRVTAVSIHPSMWEREEISNYFGQPAVYRSQFPPVGSTFDIAVIQVLGLPDPGRDLLPVFSDQAAAVDDRLSIDGNTFDKDKKYLNRLTRTVTLRSVRGSNPERNLYSEPVMIPGNSGGPLYAPSTQERGAATLFGILSGDGNYFANFPNVSSTVYTRVDGQAMHGGVSVKAWIEAIEDQHRTDLNCTRFGM